MNEKLLQYLWNFKVFKSFDFKDTEGHEVEILDFGKWNHDAGPDFLMAKIKTKNITLVGNIELHVKSSDWVFHRHSGNPEYENLILHGVFQHDVDLEEFKKKNIPTVELKSFIEESVLAKYQAMLEENQFIACEKLFDAQKIPFFFSEENLIKKLDEKSLEIEHSLQRFKNDYEAVLFHQLAYAFGLKVNAPIFKQLAESIDFSIIKKISRDQKQLESLFFGSCRWLENPEDQEMKVWKREYDFLKIKFQLPDFQLKPKFSKLRPHSFPSIRLSQFASLYSLHQQLFAKVMDAKNIEELKSIFVDVKASDYWNNHFSFGKISSVEGEKKLTSDFVEIIILNAILPLKYAYHKNRKQEIYDNLIAFYAEMSPEKNTIIDRWKTLKTPINSALHSQAFLFHYKNYCQPKKCLNCGIGFQLLKQN